MSEAEYLRSACDRAEARVRYARSELGARAELGRVLISRQPNADLDALPTMARTCRYVR
jgi:hypothetical protein